METVDDKNLRNPVIVMADDDMDDCILVNDAFHESRFTKDLYFVEDGEELMNYLHRRGKYSEPGAPPLPDLILLDLNMPRKDGREVLREIKADSRLFSIPVIVLTTSNEEEDVISSYRSGASSFITKPVTFKELVDVIRSIGRYWFEIVKLPNRLRN